MHRVIRNPKTEAGEEEEKGHQGEGGKEKVSAPKGVDGVDGRDGENKVDDAKSKRRSQSIELWKIGFDENLGRVIGDDIYSAELLKEHAS